MGRSEGILWIFMGAILSILALQYDLGSFRAPGPGFVAFLAGIFVGGMGAIMALSARAPRPTKEAVPAASGRRLFANSRVRLVYTVILLVGYAILMAPLGFIVSTSLVMFGLFFDWEKKNWFRAVVSPIVIALISYLVFEVWLQCQLPRGILPWW